jgi:hypothetical protein
LTDVSSLLFNKTNKYHALQKLYSRGKNLPGPVDRD